MKAMSEFPAHLLQQALQMKKTLSTEGKTDDEVLAALGESLKLKENRLKYILAALTVAEPVLDKLYRVRVLSFDEGETVPEKATKIEEAYFLAELTAQTPPAKPVTVKAAPGGRGGGKKDRPRGPKPSPWGLSPEELAAKKEASSKAAAGKAPASN